MDKNEFISSLTKIFGINKLDKLLNREKSEKFYKLTEFLLAENEKYNLTAIKTPEKIISNHYADCAALAQRLPHGAKVADIGAGAGFPTLPVAILREDVEIIAIDSTEKRVNYMKSAAAILGLNNVSAVAMRAEDGGLSPEYREKFDIATARAVAELRVLAELCLPYVKVGGSMIAMKGRNAEFELSLAKRAIAILGGSFDKCENIVLKDGEEELSHPLIYIRKKTKTPQGYPRPYAKISKTPL